MTAPLRDSSAGASPLQAARAAAARGGWGEVRALLAGHTAVGEDAEHTLLLAEAQLRTGDLAEARALLAPLAARLAAGGNSAFRRRAVNMLGAAAFELGELAEAEARFQEALALASAGEDPLTAGRATNNLGMIAHIRGRYDESLARYQLAVPVYQRTGSLTGLAETHHNMALALRELAQLDAAEKQERRAIEFAREAGNGRLLAMAHVGRAELLLRRGNAVVAEAGARLGAEEYAAIPDAVGEADALRLAGAARTALGHLAAARQALDRAVDLASGHGSALIEAEARAARARLAAAEGNADGVRADVAAALALFERLGAVDDRTALERWLRDVGG